MPPRRRRSPASTPVAASPATPRSPALATPPPTNQHLTTTASLSRGQPPPSKRRKTYHLADQIPHFRNHLEEIPDSLSEGSEARSSPTLRQYNFVSPEIADSSPLHGARSVYAETVFDEADNAHFHPASPSPQPSHTLPTQPPISKISQLLNDAIIHAQSHLRSDTLPGQTHWIAGPFPALKRISKILVALDSKRHNHRHPNPVAARTALYWYWKQLVKLEKIYRFLKERARGFEAWHHDRRLAVIAKVLWEIRGELEAARFVDPEGKQWGCWPRIVTGTAEKIRGEGVERCDDGRGQIEEDGGGLQRAWSEEERNVIMEILEGVWTRAQPGGWKGRQSWENVERSMINHGIRNLREREEMRLEMARVMDEMVHNGGDAPEWMEEVVGGPT